VKKPARRTSRKLFKKSSSVGIQIGSAAWIHQSLAGAQKGETRARGEKKGTTSLTEKNSKERGGTWGY